MYSYSQEDREEPGQVLLTCDRNADYDYLCSSDAFMGKQSMKHLCLVICSVFSAVSVSCGLYAAENFQADTARGGTGVPSGKETPKVHFAYDVNFEMKFDNRENTVSLSPSMTIFGARLTPELGIGVRQSDGTRHRVMLGVDVMKDFGKGPDVSADGTVTGDRGYANAALFHEMTLYYRLEKRMGKTGFALTAGIFPKRYSMSEEYSPAFISDSLKFYDNNYEGLLLSFSRPKSYYEVGCDWMGMFGVYERERFMLFSYGKSRLLPWLSLGYTAYMYHYACSATVDGVVDNILLNPSVCLDIAPFVPLQQLSLTIGWLQGAQQDRLNVGKYVLPCGGEAVFDIRKWNVGIRNRLFIGCDLMPYYDSMDAGGNRYGSGLYWGDPFYRLFPGNDSRFRPGGAMTYVRERSVALYDRLEAYYEPRIADFLYLKVGLVAHFLESGYAGFHQQVSLVFNLQELLSSTATKR